MTNIIPAPDFKPGDMVTWLGYTGQLEVINPNPDRGGYIQVRGELGWYTLRPQEELRLVPPPPPKRYVVELRAPLEGERLLDVYGSVSTAKASPHDRVRSVIIEEIQ